MTWYDTGKKNRGEDRAEALPIFTGPPGIDGVVWSDRRRNHQEDPPHGPCRRGGGGRSPQVLPELFGAPSGRKTQGGRQGGSPADFLLGPQASTELVGPPGGKIKGSTGRSGSAADLLRGPQASTGSTGGKLQGKTGQGVSAADFFFFRPLGRPARPSGTTPFSSAALFGPPGRDKVADRAVTGERRRRNRLGSGLRREARAHNNGGPTHG
jgi:hypothetical protein